VSPADPWIALIPIAIAGIAGDDGIAGVAAKYGPSPIVFSDPLMMTIAIFRKDLHFGLGMVLFRGMGWPAGNC
jgi:hypothetical protein